MRFKNLLLLLLISLVFTSPALATKLPDGVVNYIKKESPNASIRFDGLVTLHDSTIYLPVLPAKFNKDAVQKVVTTYPANKTLSQKPDVILFDSNFALLKVIKGTNDKYSFTDPSNIPYIVKTGVLPQDLLVPPGLIMPDELNVMMGDLNIPLTSSKINNFLVDKPKGVPVRISSFAPNSAMASKHLLITSLNSNTINVVPANTTAAKYTIDLEGLQRFVEPVDNDKYLLIATSGKTTIDVADIKLAVLAKKIDLAAEPSEILINHDKTRAYVAVSDDEAIFVIDLKTMSVVEKIKVKGYPKNIAFEEKYQYIAYIDKSTGDIYTLNVNSENYENKFAAKSSNLSKILPVNNLIFALSRTQNELQIVDTRLQDYIYAQKVGDKPTDMLLYNKKLYVLSANNEISIFSLADYNLSNVVNVNATGFSKQLFKVPDSNIALITNVSDKKYFVFDLDSEKVIQTVPTDYFINNLKLLSNSVR